MPPLFRFLILSLLSLVPFVLNAAPAAPARLQVESHNEPCGLDEQQLRFSWWISDAAKDAVQAAYEIQIIEMPLVGSGKKEPWSTGKIATAQSVNVVPSGFAPKAKMRYSWRVRTWDAGDAASPWSKPAYFEMGLLGNDAWNGAKWIGHPARDTGKSVPATYVRTQFAAKKTIVSARAYATARGLFELWINGKRIGDDYFSPGWTDYGKTNQYLTYDVTKLLNTGANGIGAVIGDGWYSGYLIWARRKNFYGPEPSVRVRLDVYYTDGTSDTIFSNDTWKATTGPILASDFYNGETYDARLELGNWSAPQYDASKWGNVQVLPEGREKLVGKISQPIRIVETLKPKTVTKAKNDEWVFDLGQNMVGIPRLKLQGKAGQTVTLRFAEMLNDDGTLYVANLRHARATDTYTFAKDGTITWSPTFTFHGFRYVGLAGVATTPALDAIEGLVMHTDMPKTGSFVCSDPLINQLQSNITWGQRGNFLDVPTDCPQRDERLGWTGDAQIFVKTATFNYDVRAFFEKWMGDVRDAQFKNGAVPDIVPAPQWDRGGSSAWGDAVTVVPWTLYQQYGDRRILEENYHAMKAWVEYLKTTAPEGIRPESGYGDWLALDINDPRNAGRTNTPKALVGTAYFARSSEILARAAEVLGKMEDAQKYQEMRNFARDAFVKKFVSADGKITGNTQTGYLLALAFDLLPENLRGAATENLIDDIRKRDWHLTTGFVGTGILMPTLDAIGQQEVAYKLLKQDTYPSWLYSIHQGATTMWERWNSYTKDKGFGPVGMNSFNHYAYGAVGEWMYARVGGLSALEPGFKKSLIAPEPGGGITSANCALDTPYGRLACDWKIVGNAFQLNAIVPPNTTATIALPDGTSKEVGSGKYEYRIAWPVKK